MFTASIWVLVLISAVQCVHGASVNKAKDTVKERIVGGVTVERGTFKFMAHIRASRPDQRSTNSVGGALISNQWVLTCAHCIFEYVNFLVTLGTVDLNLVDSNRQVFNFSGTVSTKIVHPGYTPNSLRNDIALLKLPRVATTNYYVAPIRLPKKSEDTPGYFYDKFVNILGFGSTQYLNGPPSPILKIILNHKVILNSVCQQSLDVVDSNICSKGPAGHNVCSGDSGGPVIWSDNADYLKTLVGIVSFGVNTENCDNLTPAAHVRLTKYLDWILPITGIAPRT